MKPSSSLLEPFLALFSSSTGMSPEIVAAIVAGLELATIIGVSFGAAWLFKRVVLERLDAWAQTTETDLDDRLVYFVRRFYNAIVLFLVSMGTLHVMGVEITPLLAGAGIAGVAVAYAGKDLLGNLIGGVVMIVDQPIRIGDRIQIERIGREWGSWGDVVDIGLRTTTIKNTDGVCVTYPNARLSDSVIKNFSPREQQPVRFRVRVLMSLDNDLEACLQTMEEVASQTPGLLDVPPPKAILRGLYDDEGGHTHQGALLELRCWVPDVRVRTAKRSEMLLALHKAFRERGHRFGRMEVVGLPPDAARDAAP